MSAFDSQFGVGQGVSSKVVGRKGFDWGRLIRYCLLIFFVAVVLMPVYVLVVTSFKGVGDADPSRAWALPQVWTLDSWKAAFQGLGGIQPVGPALARTALMVIPAAIISSLLGSANGFVLSRWSFPGANIVFAFILFGMFIPYQAVMVPLYGLVNDLNWLVPKGIPVLIMLHVIYGIPITTLIFRNYYQSVPQELIEASRVDGGGMLRTYFSVVLPISMPSFVVVLIWQFTSAWNDFLFARFFGGNMQTQAPVTVVLQNMAVGGTSGSVWGATMAATILSSLPTLIVYILLGKYFIGGLMSGSVKG
ncbi:MAG: carbohydrate ABC transporter permease [Bifidobacteriaceae bacterium]|jgi:glucose/mannose transport system permease protein|nr:carbohydrate ABC transporter permease [Bifidobacteriaceae bacterium]